MFGKVNLPIVAVLLSAAVASAQSGRPLMPASPTHAVVSGAEIHSGQSVIHGTAVDANASPLPNVPVRLRNLVTSEIESTSTANDVGEFTFIVQPDIPYIVEIADRTGRIIAVGNVVTAQAGEVAATLVPVPLKLPALAGVFGETAGSIVAAVAGTGLTAIEANVKPPVSPDR